VHPHSLATPEPPHVYGAWQLPLVHCPPQPSDAPHALPEQLGVHVQFCWHEPLPGPHWLYVDEYPAGHQLKVAPSEVGVPLQ
jgi:hypothetical protein